MSATRSASDSSMISVRYGACDVASTRSATASDPGASTSCTLRATASRRPVSTRSSSPRAPTGVTKRRIAPSTSTRAAACPLERVFFTSSTAVYGQSNGEWVDESSATEPTGFNGKVLLEAEQLVSDAPELGVNVRLSGIYGPGRTRLVRKVWSGEATATGGWTNRIHVEDCAGALHHLMGLSNPAPLYLGSDDLPVRTVDVVNWMAEKLGKPMPQPASTARLNKRCRNARLRQSGYRFIYPTFREGYPSIIDEFRRASVRRMMWNPKGVSTTPLVSPTCRAKAASSNPLTI